MIKEILKIFEKHSTLQKVEFTFDEMLVLARDMFFKATTPLESAPADENLRTYLWEKDEEINKLESTIRRRLYTHLVVGKCATSDLSSVMAFMSLVKDAERLGDFCKNVFRVLRSMKEEEKPDAKEKLLKLRKNILKQFDNIREVLQSDDQKRTLEIVNLSKRDQQRCQTYIKSLIEGTDEVDCTNAVACALLFRYFKRVLSHQINIATSVYLPLDKLDFFDEPMPED